jgi:hypothetical protein
MDDRTFLNWLADRLVHVYGESPNTDFVLRLREMDSLIEELRTRAEAVRKEREKSPHD